MIQKAIQVTAFLILPVLPECYIARSYLHEHNPHGSRDVRLLKYLCLAAFSKSSSERFVTLSFSIQCCPARSASRHRC